MAKSSRFIHLYCTLSLVIVAGAWAQQPGIIDTIAGNGTAGFSGDGGLATSASLVNVTGIAADAAGNIYLATADNEDVENNCRIRKIDTAGIISTIAGTGTCSSGGENVPALSAPLNNPYAMEVNAAGDLFIAESSANRVRKIDHSTGLISTVAGTGARGRSGDGGLATAAKLYIPIDVAFDSQGNLFISDAGNERIRKVDHATGVISTVAGNGTAGSSGDGGPATAASMANYNIALDADDNLYIGDQPNNRVRKVDHWTQIISTIAGDGVSRSSGDGGPATNASFYYPYSLAFNSSGDLFLSDSFGSVRMVNTAGIISTIAGISGHNVYAGDGGQATSATFRSVGTSAVNGDYLYIADQNRVRRINLPPAVSKNFGSSPVNVATNPVSVGFHSFSGTAVTYQMKYGTEFSVDRSSCSGGANYSNCSVTFTPLHPGIRQDVLLAFDACNGLIGTEMVYGIGQGPLPVFVPGTISTVYTPAGAAGNNGNPQFMAKDAAGNIYVSHTLNNTVTKLDTTGTVTLVAGNGSSVSSGDGGPATSAGLRMPTGVAVDAAGNLYIAESQGHKIRKVGTQGDITTVAGTGSPGYSGDGGPATSAELYGPYGITFDAAGNLYIADSFNTAIRKVTPEGGIMTVESTYMENGVPTTLNPIGEADGVTVDENGNLYVADSMTGAIWKRDASGIINRFVSVDSVWDVVVDPAGNIYWGDTEGATIGKAGIATAAATIAHNVHASGLLMADDGTLYFADGSGVVRKMSPTISLAFPDTNAGATSASKSAQTLWNIGNADLSLSALAVSSNFALDGAGPCSTSTTLTNTDSTGCSFAVAFQPASTGSLTGTLTVTPGLQVALSGMGTVPVPAPAPTPTPGNGQETLSVTSLDFANQAPGTTSAAQTVTLTITGNGLTLTGVKLTGANAREFAITSSCATSVGTSTGCMVSVSFAPTSTGNKTAKLVFGFSDGEDETINMVSLTGVSSTAAGPGANVPTGIIKIASVQSGKVLDVLGASTLNGAVLQQYEYLNGANQLWMAVAVDENYYKIVNVGSGKALDADGMGTTNGTTIQQWNYLGGDNQKWQFVPQPDGSFEIKNKMSGRALDVANYSTANQARIQLWDYNGTNNQKWQLISVTMTTPSVQYYTINSLDTGKVLDVVDMSTTDQARIQQWDYLHGANQQWQLIPTDDGYYQIVNRLSGKVLDAVEAGTTDGTPVQQYHYVSGANQQWQLVPTANGYYQIVNRLSGKVLDVTGVSSANGARLQTWTYLGSANQQFSLTAVLDQ